ncbi:MAG: hypothetical protein IT372_07925 [Polyangiaceae bacterium]|nr:hypothetical protein [Polyangiaceae bacterium]
MSAAARILGALPHGGEAEERALERFREAHARGVRRWRDEGGGHVVVLNVRENDGIPSVLVRIGGRELRYTMRSTSFWIPIEPTALEWLRATVRAELEAILERIWREDHAGRDVPMPRGPRAMVIEVLEKAVHDCLGGTEADAALLRDLGAESLRARIRADVEPVVRRACAADRPS